MLLGILVLGATDIGGMRLMLFMLLMVAVGLLLAGSIIALMTLRNQRKTAVTNFASKQLAGEKG